MWISLSTFLDGGSWLYQPTQKVSMHQKFEIPNCFNFLAKIDFLIKMWVDYSFTSVKQCFLKNHKNYAKVLLGMGFGACQASRSQKFSETGWLEIQIYCYFCDQCSDAMRRPYYMGSQVQVPFTSMPMGKLVFLETHFPSKEWAKHSPKHKRAKRIITQNFEFDSMPSGQLLSSVGGMTVLQHKIGA